MTIFGHLMRYSRVCSGLTIEEVSEHLCVSRSTVQRLEQGEITDPRYQMLRAIAKLYNIDMNAINLAMDCDAAGMASGTAADEAMWDLAFMRLSPEQRADVVAMAICTPQAPAVNPCPYPQSGVAFAEEVAEEVMGVILGAEVQEAIQEAQEEIAEAIEEAVEEVAEDIVEQSEEPWFKPLA